MSTPELSTQAQADFDRFFYCLDVPKHGDRYYELRTAFCAGALSRQNREAFDRFVHSLSQDDSEVEAC